MLNSDSIGPVVYERLKSIFLEIEIAIPMPIGENAFCNQHVASNIGLFRIPEYQFASGGFEFVQLVFQKFICSLCLIPVLYKKYLGCINISKTDADQTIVWHYIQSVIMLINCGIFAAAYLEKSNNIMIFRILYLIMNESCFNGIIQSDIM